MLPLRLSPSASAKVTVSLCEEVTVRRTSLGGPGGAGGVGLVCLLSIVVHCDTHVSTYTQTHTCVPAKCQLCVCQSVRAVFLTSRTTQLLHLFEVEPPPLPVLQLSAQLLSRGRGMQRGEGRDSTGTGVESEFTNHTRAPSSSRADGVQLLLTLKQPTLCRTSPWPWSCWCSPLLAAPASSAW